MVTRVLPLAALVTFANTRAEGAYMNVFDQADLLEAFNVSDVLRLDPNATLIVGRLVEIHEGSTVVTPVQFTYLLAQHRIKYFRRIGRPVVVSSAQPESASPLSTLPFAVPADASGAALALSRDGQTVVGYYDNGFVTPDHAFRWTESTDVVDLGTLDPPNNSSRGSSATDVSSDGSVVVGYSDVTAQGAIQHAFRWTQAGGMVDLGSGAGPGGSSRALGVSADGSVIVGESDFPGGFSGTVRQAFRWTQAGGFEKLGALDPDYPSLATAVNADGSVVIGVSGVEVMVGNSSINGSRAFRWTQTGGMQDLSAGLGNTTSAATGVSDDGSIVVGIFVPGSNTGSFLPNQPPSGSFPVGSGSRAFQWTASAGSTDLNQLLAAAGADLAGATIVAATGISPDGQWISGAAITPTTDPGETTAMVASLTYTLPPETSRLLNLSTRGLAQSGDNVLIPGFVISGTGTKNVLIRAIGPSLGDLVPSFTVIPDPQMTLRKLNTDVLPAVYEVLGTNDNWGTNANAAAITSTADQVFAFPFTDANDAALLMNLPAGQYTVTAGDINGTSGIAIVELYDADAPNPAATLINISNRGFCGVGDEVMIPGFVVSAESPRTVLVRVVGPKLNSFGVPGTMTDPKLTVYSGQTPIHTNDNWNDDPHAATTTQVAAQVSAFALDPGSKDAAMVVTLAPGSYTVGGSSAVAGGTGVVLVEVYVVPVVDGRRPPRQCAAPPAVCHLLRDKGAAAPGNRLSPIT